MANNNLTWSVAKLVCRFRGGVDSCGAYLDVVEFLATQFLSVRKSEGAADVISRIILFCFHGWGVVVEVTRPFGSTIGKKILTPS